MSGVQVGRWGARGHPWLHREFEDSLGILVCFLLLYKTLAKTNLRKKGFIWLAGYRLCLRESKAGKLTVRGTLQVITSVLRMKLHSE